MNIVITNQFYFHYEVIESIIAQYDTICKIDKSTDDTIYLFIQKNVEFINYIKEKYPSIIITIFPFTNPISYVPHTYDKYINKVVKYDYYIDCTTFNSELIKSYTDNYVQSVLKPPDNKHYYIYHQINDEVADNILYITPIGKEKGRVINPYILPFTDEINRNKTVPIYIINGGISPNIRNYALLEKILSKQYDKPFIIKLIGYKYGITHNYYTDINNNNIKYPDIYSVNEEIINNELSDNKLDKMNFNKYNNFKKNGNAKIKSPYVYLPCIMNKQVNINIIDKTDNINDYLPSTILDRLKEEPINKSTIIYNIDYEFIDFHREFLDAYCIISLISKKSHPYYYNVQMTSSINYGIGYNLKFLIDKDLNDIYQLDDVEIYIDETDIIDAFEKTLNDFYTIPL